MNHNTIFSLFAVHAMRTSHVCGTVPRLGRSTGISVNVSSSIYVVCTKLDTELCHFYFDKRDLELSFTRP